MTDFIREYYQKIKDGSVQANQWITLLFEYIIKGLQKKLFFYDSKKANRAVKFVENYCHHSKGRCDLLKLELWQKAIIATIFGVVDKDNYRQFREVILIVGRKNGKSLLAAAIIAYMSYLDGEYGAEVYCLAPKLEQADIVYNCFWQMTQLEPELKQMIKRRKSDLFIEETNTTIKKIAFNAKKSDGFNPHLVVCDEIASWQGDAGKKQYEVMKSALGARKQPMILSVSTAGYTNDGIYDELFLRGTQFLMGKSKEQRLLPIIYMIDDLDKWNDINELSKSLPNLGVSVSVDYMLEEIAIAEQSLSKKAEFLCKYCDVKQNSSIAWLPVRAIEKASGAEITLEDLADTYCVGGIDLSQTTDLTSACIVVEKDGVLYVYSHFWMPSEKLSDAIARDSIPYDEYIQQGVLTLAGDNFVDYHAVYDWFVDLVANYKILPLKIGYDRYSSQYLVQDLEEFGFQMDDVFQGYNLTPVIHETEGLIKDGTIRIGKNQLLKAHLYDTALENDARNGRVRIIKVDKKKSHIDGTAALLDAMCVRQKWHSEIGTRLANK